MQDILYELFSFNNTFCHVELLNSTCFGHARQIIKKEERDCPHKTRTPAYIEVTNERWTVQNKRPEEAQTERKNLGRDCWRNTLNRDEYILDVCST
jgi:hypothetical protein